MNLRALTAFHDPGWPLDPERIDAVAKGLHAAREALSAAGYVVQTLRLATPPPAEMQRRVPPDERAELAQQLEAECFVHGIDYAALGPARPDDLEWFAAVSEILDATENVFTSAIFADLETGLALPAARACAETIEKNASLRPDGLTNIRFAALANVGPGSPFFPAAFHGGGPSTMAVGTEAAELAVDAFREAPSPSTARRRLVSMIEAHAAAITRSLQPLAGEGQLQFTGIDFTLAPYPEHLRSIGTALESFGVPAVGLPGTLAAAAFLSDCVDQAQFTRAGFSGLFLPVLEDLVLAGRAADGTLTVTDLLLYSTVCGSGLDTVPLPGDVGVEALYAVLLDVGAIALRHNKPLSARLMPLPGKQAGDEIQFDFPYFTDSRVLDLPAQPLTGLLGSSGILDIHPRPR